MRLLRYIILCTVITVGIWCVCAGSLFGLTEQEIIDKSMPRPDRSDKSRLEEIDYARDIGQDSLNKSMTSDDSIVAKQGSIYLANGEKKSTLSFDSDGLISIAIDDSTDIVPIPETTRTGNGYVRLSVKEAKNAFLSLVNDDKKIQAAKVVEEDGIIVLMTDYDKPAKVYAKEIDKEIEEDIIESVRIIEAKPSLDAISLKWPLIRTTDAFLANQKSVPAGL